jgi:hypothetical protein
MLVKGTKGFAEKGYRKAIGYGYHKYWRIMMNPYNQARPIQTVGTHPRFHIGALQLREAIGGRDISGEATILEGHTLPAQSVEGYMGYDIPLACFLPAVHLTFSRRVRIAEYGIALSNRCLGWFLEYSDDNVNWVQLDEVDPTHAVRDTGGSVQPIMYWRQVHTNLPKEEDQSGAYRHWRVIVNEPHAYDQLDNVHLYRIELLDGATDVTQTAAVVGSDPMKAAGDNSYATTVFDGNSGTLTDAPVGFAYYVELPDVVALTGYAIHSGRSSAGEPLTIPKVVTLQYSRDGKNWFIRHTKTFAVGEWTAVDTSQRVEVTI